MNGCFVRRALQPGIQRRDHIRLDERTRFMKGLFAWIGYHEVTLDYDVQERVAGTTKWRYGKLWSFALEGITSFSVAPLKLVTTV